MSEENGRYGILFVHLPIGASFLYEGRFYQKIEPVSLAAARGFHNCIDEKGNTGFIMARRPVCPVAFKEIRSAGGKLLFKYSDTFGLIEIKPKGEERPLLVKLAEV